MRRRHSHADVMEIIRRKSQVLPSGCVVWLGRVRNGYGLICFEDKMQNVHRTVYVICNGPIPDGLNALHTCDNRRCWNQEHVYLGTNVKNIADKCSRDRSGKKLTIAKVIEIRQRHAAGATQCELAAEFDVRQSNISRAINGKRWAHVQCAGGV